LAAKDAYHEAVIAALKKDRWVVTHDPLYLAVGGVEMYIDLGAEPLIAAEKDDQKIAVEVKSFLQPSTISEFHTAVGQFLNYRRALRTTEPDRRLYLAVPLEIYKTFFMLPFIREGVEEYQLLLLVYDAEEKVITLWQK
jgi:hypothetical protein